MEVEALPLVHALTVYHLAWKRKTGLLDAPVIKVVKRPSNTTTRPPFVATPARDGIASGHYLNYGLLAHWFRVRAGGYTGRPGACPMSSGHVFEAPTSTSRSITMHVYLMLLAAQKRSRLAMDIFRISASTHKTHWQRWSCRPQMPGCGGAWLEVWVC